MRTKTSKGVTYKRLESATQGVCRMIGEFKTRDIDESKLQVEFIMSNFTRDDFGTRFDPNGVDISQYVRNPFVSFGHMRGQNNIDKLPVGKGLPDSIHVDQDGNLRMIVQFTTEEEFAFGHTVYKLVKNEFLNMGSIAAEILEEELIKEADGSTTLVFKKWKLFDFSIVPIGANDDALAVARCKELGLDRKSLVEMEKGLMADGDKIEDEDVVKALRCISPDDKGITVSRDDGEKKEEPKEGEEVVEETKDGKKKKPKKDDEGKEEKSKDDISMEMEKAGNVLLFRVNVEHDDKTVTKRWTHRIESVETEDQKKHREYFEKNKEVLKNYRDLMKKLYTRVGETPPSNELVAVERLTNRILQPKPDASGSPHARKLRASDITTLVESLLPALDAQVREALRKGLPVKKADAYKRELVRVAVSSISHSPS